MNTFYLDHIYHAAQLFLAVLPPPNFMSYLLLLSSFISSSSSPLPLPLPLPVLLSLLFLFFYYNTLSLISAASMASMSSMDMARVPSTGPGTTYMGLTPE